MNRSLLLGFCLAGALAGCATGRAGSEEPEFVGRSMQVVAANGQTSTLRFRRDGGVTARFGEQESEGRWELRPRELCFTWARSFQECWPYTEPFRRGRETTIRSDRGNVVRVTLR